MFAKLSCDACCEFDEYELANRPIAACFLLYILDVFGYVFGYVFGLSARRLTAAVPLI